MMKKVTFLALVGLIMAAFVAGSSSVSLGGTKELKPGAVKPKLIYKPKPIPIPPPRLCNGPDPAVTSLRVTKSIVVRNGVRTGILRITATLKNVGTQNYVSRPGQQSFAIWVKNPEATGPSSIKVVVSRDFPRLNKGASITISGTYQIPRLVQWNHRQPRYGECKAGRVIWALVSYDPDITMDSNPHNDDCSLRNNKKRYTVKYMVECPW